MGKRILAVDDEPDILIMLKMVLEEENYEVETVTSGLDCIQSAQENPPDLILLDVMMPKMTGFEVLAELKKMPPTDRIPVIMLTVLSEHEMIEEARESGVEDYVIKSHGFSDLIEKVRRTFKAQENQH